MTGDVHALKTLVSVAPETVGALPIVQVVLALGSNHQAQKHLAYVQEKMTTLGAVQYSKAYQNPDFTATPERPKPDYVNQCVYLRLDDARTLAELRQLFAALESDCQRCRMPATPHAPHAVRLVTMDIDILLIKATAPAAAWQLLSNRVPLKAHERIGVAELLPAMGLHNI